MSDVDRIIEQLLGDRRMTESASFSTRSYSDQPILEKGSDLKARMEQRARERAERHEREARERRDRAHRSSWNVVEGVKTARPTREQLYANIPPRSLQTSQPASSPSYAALLDDIKRQEWSLEARLKADPRPGKRLTEEIPEPIKEMRKLEGAGVPRTLSYGSSSAAALFYRQARLMEDYEDDYAFSGSFVQYYPTYATLSNSQLRGYFSWRTKLRAGQMEPAPLSFAFVYAYELLMGIGTTPGRQGLEDLRAFGKAYRNIDELLGMRLNSYLRRWLEDYAVYHDIPEGYQRKATSEQNSSVLTLYQAEHAYLTQHQRKPHIPHSAARDIVPTDEQTFQALGAASSYHICSSRLAKAEPDLVRAAALDVFRALVMHCSKRRKTDYVEGLFGYASRIPYTMFSAAVFYEEEPHADCLIRVSDAEAYECINGRWWHTLAFETSSSSSELGLAMHAVDFELRQQLDYPYPLKQRQAPKYLQKIVRESVARCLEQRAEAERRRISIDLSKLGDIRAAAAVTQEALLTDEERGEDTVAVPQPQAPQTQAPSPQEEPSSLAEPPQPAQDGPLSPEEAQLLAGLLAGTPASELAGTRAQFMSVLVDSINEKLFDIVGDAVIEFDGDSPCIIEDYVEDVREVLSS